MGCRVRAARAGDQVGRATAAHLAEVIAHFTTGRARTNDEQPLADWLADLRDAGFAEIAASVIDDYWWAPAFFVDARRVPAAVV